MMKNRLTTTSQNKNNTPLKQTQVINGISTSQNTGGSNLGLNSEERKKLYNTFMKEMNSSISQNTSKKNK